MYNPRSSKMHGGRGRSQSNNARPNRRPNSGQMGSNVTGRSGMGNMGAVPMYSQTQGQGLQMMTQSTYLQGDVGGPPKDPRKQQWYGTTTTNDYTPQIGDGRSMMYPNQMSNTMYSNQMGDTSTAQYSNQMGAGSTTVYPNQMGTASSTVFPNQMGTASSTAYSNQMGTASSTAYSNQMGTASSTAYSNQMGTASSTVYPNQMGTASSTAYSNQMGTGTVVNPMYANQMGAVSSAMYGNQMDEGSGTMYSNRPMHPVSSFETTDQLTAQPMDLETASDPDLYETSVYIGINDMPDDFDVRKRILGEKGENLDYIRRTTGAKVLMKGRGSGVETHKPLHIFVSHATLKGMEDAEKLAHNLSKVVQEDLEDYFKRKSFSNTGGAIGDAGFPPAKKSSRPNQDDYGYGDSRPSWDRRGDVDRYEGEAGGMRSRTSRNDDYNREGFNAPKSQQLQQQPVEELYFCDLCNIRCPNEEMFITHKKGLMHAQNIELNRQQHGQQVQRDTYRPAPAPARQERKERRQRQRQGRFDDTQGGHWEGPPNPKKQRTEPDPRSTVANTGSDKATCVEEWVFYCCERMLEMQIDGNALRNLRRSVEKIGLRSMAAALPTRPQSSNYCKLCKLETEQMQVHLTSTTHGVLYLLRQIQLGDNFIEYYSDVPIPGVITNGGRVLAMDALKFGPCIPETNRERFKEFLVYSGAFLSYNCKVCDVRINALNPWIQHTTSKKHGKQIVTTMIRLGFDAYMDKYKSIPVPPPKNAMDLATDLLIKEVHHSVPARRASANLPTAGANLPTAGTSNVLGNPQKGSPTFYEKLAALNQNDRQLVLQVQVLTGISDIDVILTVLNALHQMDRGTLDTLSNVEPVAIQHAMAGNKVLQNMDVQIVQTVIQLYARYKFGTNVSPGRDGGRAGMSRSVPSLMGPDFRGDRNENPRRDRDTRDRSDKGRSSRWQNEQSDRDRNLNRKKDDSRDGRRDRDGQKGRLSKGRDGKIDENRDRKSHEKRESGDRQRDNGKGSSSKGSSKGRGDKNVSSREKRNEKDPKSKTGDKGKEKDNASKTEKKNDSKSSQRKSEDKDGKKYSTSKDSKGQKEVKKDQKDSTSEVKKDKKDSTSEVKKDQKDSTSEVKKDQKDSTSEVKKDQKDSTSEVNKDQKGQKAASSEIDEGQKAASSEVDEGQKAASSEVDEGQKDSSLVVDEVEKDSSLVIDEVEKDSSLVIDGVEKDSSLVIDEVEKDSSLVIDEVEKDSSLVIEEGQKDSPSDVEDDQKDSPSDVEDDQKDTSSEKLLVIESDISEEMYVLKSEVLDETDMELNDEMPPPMKYSGESEAISENENVTEKLEKDETNDSTKETDEKDEVETTGSKLSQGDEADAETSTEVDTPKDEFTGIKGEEKEKSPEGEQHEEEQKSVKKEAGVTDNDSKEIVEDIPVKEIKRSVSEEVGDGKGDESTVKEEAKDDVKEDDVTEEVDVKVEGVVEEAEKPKVARKAVRGGRGKRVPRRGVAVRGRGRGRGMTKVKKVTKKSS